MRRYVSSCTLVSIYSARIRAARGFAGLTQSDLAERLGVDEHTIKRRESPGGKEPKKGERIAIATICDVPRAFLEGGWAALAAEPSDDQVKRAAALLEQPLVQAALALRLAAAEAPTDTDAPHPPDSAAGGGAS